GLALALSLRLIELRFDELAPLGFGLLAKGERLDFAAHPGGRTKAPDRPADAERRDESDKQERRLRRPAVGPLHQAFERVRGAGLDRVAVEPALEIVGQSLGRAVALAGVLLQTLQRDRREIRVGDCVQRPGVLRLVLADLAERLDRRVRAERRAAGQ